MLYQGIEAAIAYLVQKPRVV